MTHKKPTLLFIPYHPTSWPAMFKLALEFKEKGAYKPVMFITEDIQDKQQECFKMGIDCHFLNSDYMLSQSGVEQGVVKNEQKKIGMILNIRNIFYVIVRKIYRALYSLLSLVEQKTSHKILRYSFHQLIRAVVEFAYYKNGQKIANRLLDIYQPKAVFMYVDNAGGVFGCVSKECENRGIKVIIPVVAFQYRDIVATRRARTSYMHLKGKGSPWINRYLKRIVPDQFYVYDNQELMFYLPYETLAMHWVGILPPFPWIRGKNRCSVLCVEDFHQKIKLEELDVDSKKIVVAGHVDFDDLWNIKNRSTKQEFFKQYGFDETKKLIIIAVPQLFYERAVKSREEHNAEIEFLVQTAVSTDQNVLLVLHPKMKRKNYEYYESKFNCRINKGQTSDAIPFGDIYISAASSTNFWAISCGLIVINIVQLYGYTLNPFSYLDSMISIKSKQEFIEVVKKITHNNEFYDGKKKRVQENQKEYFLPLDGKNVQRYLSLVEENEGELLLK